MHFSVCPWHGPLWKSYVKLKWHKHLTMFVWVRCRVPQHNQHHHAFHRQTSASDLLAGSGGHRRQGSASDLLMSSGGGGHRRQGSSSDLGGSGARRRQMSDEGGHPNTVRCRGYG